MVVSQRYASTRSQLLANIQIRYLYFCIRARQTFGFAATTAVFDQYCIDCWLQQSSTSCPNHETPNATFFTVAATIAVWQPCFESKQVVRGFAWTMLYSLRVLALCYSVYTIFRFCRGLYSGASSDIRTTFPALFTKPSSRPGERLNQGSPPSLPGAKPPSRATVRPPLTVADFAAAAVAASQIYSFSCDAHRPVSALPERGGTGPSPAKP